MNKETLNNIAIQSFKNSVVKKLEFGNDGFQFQGLVEYNAFNKTTTEVLDVYLIIGGYEPMVKLDIYEKGKIITLEKFHFDFNPRYNNMTFEFNENDNQLIITGKNSPKLGNYQVKIKEI
jgi:hypothetical protein